MNPVLLTREEARAWREPAIPDRPMIHPLTALVLLTVLCAEAQADTFAELILRETTAFGMRRTTAERRKFHRETVTVETPHGSVAVKLGKLGGNIVQIAPEFESCKAVADKAGAPIRGVFDAARSALGS